MFINDIQGIFYLCILDTIYKGDNMSDNTCRAFKKRKGKKLYSLFECYSDNF